MKKQIPLSRLLVLTMTLIVTMGAGCHGCGKPPPIPLDVPATAASGLIFPPPDDGWSARAPMRGVASSTTIKMYEPKLDRDGRFEVNGQSFDLFFDDVLFADGDTKNAPVLVVTPPIKGTTTWAGPSHVVFRAAEPFDTSRDYTVSLPEITNPRGKKLEGGFKGTFKPNPEITIAGKIIHYVPKQGSPRAIYVRPIDDRDIGPRQTLIAIYDQPIELAAARKLVKLTTEKGQPIAISLSHPPPGNDFEGEHVDTKDIVFIKPVPALAADANIELSVASTDPAIEPQKRKLHVPPIPRIEKIGCSDEGVCKVEGQTIHGPVTTGLTVRVTNRLHDEDVEAHVKVTPAPEKLRRGSYGEEMYIDARWEPSKTYQVSWTGLKDRFGLPVPDATLTFTTAARAAHAILREGVMVLDEAAAKDMFVTTRNVKRGALSVWTVPPGAEALVSAMKSAESNEPPTTFGAPQIIPFDGFGAPHTYGKVPIDLWGKLQAGHAYLAEVEVKEPSNGAAPLDFASAGTRPSVPLFMIAGENSVGAHVHVVASKALVSVFKLATGEPAVGVSVGMGTARTTSDERGLALLDVPKDRHEANAITLKSGSEESIVPLDKISTDAVEFYPALTASSDEADDGSRYQENAELLGVLVTDRGIYRPGSKIFVKGHVRRAEGERIAAVPQQKVRLRVTDASGSDLIDAALVTSATGTIEREIPIPSGQQGGPTRIRLELDDGKHTPLTETNVRISDFEIPRFKVDIESPPNQPEGKFSARVIGKYSFGAPMEAGRVAWTLTKKEHTVQSRALEAQGFSFDREHSEFDGLERTTPLIPRTGEGKLLPDGTLDVATDLGPLAAGPTEVTFVADVTDSSYRHIANRVSQMRYPYTRYAGLRLGSTFGAVGPVNVDLVAVDKDGKSLTGAPLEARIERLDWKKSSQKAESGAVVETWGAVTSVIGSCAVTSALTPQRCALNVPKGGEYRVVSRIDGRDQATTGYYAWWGESWSAGSSDGAVPSQGKKTPISADKKSYAPGETAKVLVQSPFPEATAVLTLERGGLLSHEAKRFKGPSVVFDVPLSIAQAPYAYAVVTLLPIGGGPEASYRLGALKLPVALDSARLTISVTSAKKQYDTKETADLTVEVKRGDQPVKNADVTLAVVDEGVLRLTDFHAKDPTSALHPPRPLAFRASDSRQLLFRRHEKAHVAGGGGEGPDSVDVRQDFVETAAWLPSLTTDANGKATTKVKLPDNLTEFRMMATVVAEDGAAGAAESSFLVTRPFLLDPIMPAFASKGDKLEIAAMAHNNTDRAVKARVTILGQSRDIQLPANGHERVGIPLIAEKDLDIDFVLDIDGKTKDRVQKHLRTQLPGTEEHPQISGVFREKEEITLAVPADAIFDDDAKLILRTGAALYPELGQRLVYLHDYPHGCVEQTTSGTLPLLAARNLIPWTGVVGLDEPEIRKRITSGVKHLATMKTSNGGLAFWPAGESTNVYGTTYAARALLRAKDIGIEEPELLPGVLKFLGEQLPREREPYLRIAIAEVLAQAKKLDPSAADSLYEKVETLDAYSVASLALAFSTLPKETDRTKTLLDMLEARFDDQGILKTNVHNEHDYYYWASTDRDRAQALLALHQLRPTSVLVPALANRLIHGLDSYSTNSTAWSLMALSAYVGDGQPNGSVNVKVKAVGAVFDTTRNLGGDNKEVAFPLKDLRGKRISLVLEGDAQTPSAFSLEARYVRPDATSSRAARRSALGPSVYRVFTTPIGGPIDLQNLKPGDVVRVALRIELPQLDTWRSGFLAVTDRFAAGFSPIQPDLATVASPPELTNAHPWFSELTSWGGSASHVDVRDDRVNLYFDRVYGGHTAFASYLLRATTPGEFVMLAARAELMYEPGSEGYSEGGKVVIR